MRKSGTIHPNLVRFFAEVGHRAILHEQFKRETGSERAIIRFGEITPYANAMLRSGVPF